MSLLSVKNLSVVVPEKWEDKDIIRDVSFDVESLDILAIVGGSGSGKTTTGLSIMRLLSSGLNVQSGEILFEERDILKFSHKQMCAIRGSGIGMIFQEPLHAFNPVFTINFQIQEVLDQHTDLSSEQKAKRILEILDLVGLKDPKRVALSYPHQLSGGMRQRAMIAQAIAANPKLIIADEPTSNLDVTLQARIMELFKKLRKELSLSIILISHDLAMVSHLADKVVVMNQGRVVEKGSKADVIEHTKHEYTKKLMKVLKV